MQLPDEAITYQYQGLLNGPHDEWSPVAEMRSHHYLSPTLLKDLQQRLMQVRSQVAADRELQQVPQELKPLDAGFLDLPQKYLDDYRRKGEGSMLGRIISLSQKLRDQVDRVVVLGAGGSILGSRALFEALKHTYHNEMPAEARMGIPRMYFEGDSVDNDSLQELMELLQVTCVDPELREERWGVIVVSKTGNTLETATAYRAFMREAAEYYGAKSGRIRQLVLAATGTGGRLRELLKAEDQNEDTILTIPDNIGSRYSVFTAAGLLPAATMGLDARALLLGAAAMTKRFLEEPFERNPVLQYAGVNYLMAEEVKKPLRVLAVWSKKLEPLGRWYDQLLAESLGKQGRGSTPLTMVGTRDLYGRGQQHQDGPRDRVINNLILKSPRSVPIQIGMADHNEDDLNIYSRKSLPDLMQAAVQASNEAYNETGRPTADLIVPTLSEHTMGQLMQMLMLATVVEGRLMGINPYGQPGVESYRRHLRGILKG